MTMAENTTLEAARRGATGTEPVAGGRGVAGRPAGGGGRGGGGAGGGGGGPARRGGRGGEWGGGAVRPSRRVRREGSGAGVARTAGRVPSCRTDPAGSAMADPPGPAADRAVLFGAPRSTPPLTNRRGDTVIAGAGSSG